MRIAILGGTGEIGEGLALRWGRHTDHEVIIGSRDSAKAVDCAETYEGELLEHDITAAVSGMSNEEAVVGADIVVLAVPPYHVSDTIGDVAEFVDPESVLVSPAVGMKRDDEGFHYHRPSVGSVTAVAAENAPDDVPVVGAFHNLPANRLSTLDVPLGIDTIVVGDDPTAKRTVMDLAEDIDGIRALDGGSLANAAEVEAITPLLINLAMNNASMHDVGVSFD